MEIFPVKEFKKSIFSLCDKGSLEVQARTLVWKIPYNLESVATMPVLRLKTWDWHNILIPLDGPMSHLLGWIYQGMLRTC